MRRYLIFTFLALASLTAMAQDKLDSLYAALDKAIEQWPQYVALREERIKTKKEQLSHTNNATEEYDLTMEIFQEYRSYKSDSALVYITRCQQLAQQMGDRSRKLESLSWKAFQFSSTGYYIEAFDLLNSAQTDGASRDAMGLYYMVRMHLSGEIAYYSNQPDVRQHYYALHAQYRQQMYQYMSPENDFYLQTKEMEAYGKKDYKEALRWNNRRMKQVRPGMREYAIVAFYRYLDVRHDNRQEGNRYLLEAAITDIQNAICDQGALWEMANRLFEDGELQRPHQYVNFAWRCAETFGTKVRSWQISPVLSDINRSFQDKLSKANTKLTISIIGVSVLLVCLIALVLYVLRQNRRLADAHRRLKENANQLKRRNGELAQLNEKLSSLNSQLKESNQVKDEYVGRFMEFCSQYIDRMEEMRKKVNRMVKNHEYERLYNETRGREQQQEDLEAFYEQFDKAFLRLFPDFIEKFNALLKPEARVEVKKEGRLTTTLRIFALIRLGITDSSKIALFLHYSVNTIYNYRAQIKNGVLDNREGFEKQIAEIGIAE